MILRKMIEFCIFRDLLWVKMECGTLPNNVVSAINFILVVLWLQENNKKHHEGENFHGANKM